MKEKDSVGGKKSSVKFSKGLQMVNPHAAGLDLHQEEIWACAGPFVDGEDPAVEVFGTCTEHLRSLSAWLRAHDVESVAMESTGVYWVPPHRLLRDAGFEVSLVNSRETKAVKGRPKTDKHDCMWICRLHSYGLLRGSFVPDGLVADLRTLWGCRGRVVSESSRAIQRMNKAMLTMNCRLDIAVSDIAGESGLRIIDAILGGERDPRKLAALSDGRVQKRPDEIARALDGHFTEAQIAVLGEWRVHHQFLQDRLASLNGKILALLKQFPDRSGGLEPPPAKANYREDSLGFPEPLRPLLAKVFGSDLTQLSGVGAAVALCFLAAVGTDVGAWPTENHFASWLGLSPVAQVSAGHAKQARTKKTMNPLSAALKIAAMTSQRTDSAIGAAYRRLKGRLGPAKARTAIARKLAVVLYRVVRDGQGAVQHSAADYEAKFQEQQLKRLRAQAWKLGYDLSPVAAPAAKA